MSVILGKVVELYNYLDGISDPRTRSWFLMHNPAPGLCLIGVYLYVVYKLGPKLMEKRKPFDLKNILIVYNAFQIISSSYIFYQGLTLAWGNDYKLICEPLDESNSQRALDIANKYCYYYFILKIIDLLDTIFFVLRKKQKQISFLHVYHHAGMVALSWSIVKWLPGGHGSFLIMINSFVHIIMYFYYMLAAYDDSYKHNVGWKKHVTRLQLIQFGIITLHFTAVLFVEDCKYPLFPSLAMIPQNLFIFILFADFYRKAYMQKKTNKVE